VAGETLVRGSAWLVGPADTVLLAAAPAVDVVTSVALVERLLPHVSDLRRPLEQSQQIQPTGERLRFVASFAHEHSLDPPALGRRELQDETRMPGLASSSHARMLRTRARPSRQGRTRGFRLTDLGTAQP
jgi:hypothetical protein